MFCAGGYPLHLPCSHLSSCALLFHCLLPFPQPELGFHSKYFIIACKRGSSRFLVSGLLSIQSCITLSTSSMGSFFAATLLLGKGYKCPSKKLC